jgi:hypothetical protein
VRLLKANWFAIRVLESCMTVRLMGHYSLTGIYVERQSQHCHRNAETTALTRNSSAYFILPMGLHQGSF